jgi:uncharacterized protein (DUF58 family)
VLTRRGSLVCVVSIALAVAGRLLGIPELYSVAVVGLVMVGAALIYVRRQPFQVQAERELRPPQVYATGSSRVELSVRNLDKGRSPVLLARDPFDGGRRWARFRIAPLEPGEAIRAAYRLPTGERGVFPLGPLQLDLVDPFGLAQRSTEAAPSAALTVYPHVDEIHPLPQARGSEPTGSYGRPALTVGGEDFYALRPYQTGDDLRRVHWPATARHDEVMIRQDEVPWQGRVTVLADLRASVHSPQSLELALSAAASIIHAGWQDRRQIRLVTTDGTDTGFGSGHAHMAAIFEDLALSESHGGDLHLPALLATLEGKGGGGVALVSTDRLADEDVLAVGRLGARVTPVILVVIERSAWDPTAAARPPRPLPATTRAIRVTAGTSFAQAWDRNVPASRSRQPARAGER